MPPDAPTSDAWSDQPLIPGYEVVGLINEGGCARVWKCRGTGRLRHLVAIKVPKEAHADEAGLARFEQEIELLAKVQHPNVIKVIDRAEVFLAGRVLPGMVMPCLTAPRTIVEHADALQLGVRERIELFIQLCRGAQAFHALGAAHLDIKPDNALVDTGSDTVMLMDAGGAKVALRQDTRPPLYTLRYASPEQLGGAAPEALGPTSDVYSLGKTLAALLGGEKAVELPAFVGDSPAERTRAATGWNARRLRAAAPGLDDAVVAIVGKATNPERALRHDNALQLEQELRSLFEPGARNVRAANETWRGRLAGIPWPLRLCIGAVGLGVAAALLASVVVHTVDRLGLGPTIVPAAIEPPASIDHVAHVQIAPDADLPLLRSFDARLAGMDPNLMSSIRPAYTVLLERLVAARPKVVLLDVDLRGAVPEHDADLCTAIERLRAAGVPVVLGLNEWVDPLSETVVSPLYRAATTYGFMNVMHAPGAPLIVDLAMVRPGLGTMFGLECAAIGALADPQRGPTAEIEGVELIIRTATGVEARRIVTKVQTVTAEMAAQLSGPSGHQRPDDRRAAYPVNVPRPTVLGQGSHLHRIEDVLEMTDQAALREAFGNRAVVIGNNVGGRDMTALWRGRTDPAALLHVVALEMLLRYADVPRTGGVLLGLTSLLAAMAAMASMLAWMWIGRVFRRPRLLGDATTKSVSSGSSAALSAFIAGHLGGPIVSPRGDDNRTGPTMGVRIGTVPITIVIVATIGALALLFGAARLWLPVVAFPALFTSTAMVIGLGLGAAFGALGAASGAQGNSS